MFTGVVSCCSIGLTHWIVCPGKDFGIGGLYGSEYWWSRGNSFLFMNAGGPYAPAVTGWLFVVSVWLYWSPNGACCFWLWSVNVTSISSPSPNPPRSYLFDVGIRKSMFGCFGRAPLFCKIEVYVGLHERWLYITTISPLLPWMWSCMHCKRREIPFIWQTLKLGIDVCMTR